MGKRNGLWHAKALSLAPFHPVPTIARMCGVSERQVRRVLSEKAAQAAAAPESEPRDPVEVAEEAREADREKRCKGHLDDLQAVYGPRSPFELCIPAGPATFVRGGGYGGSSASSPAAACAELG